MILKETLLALSLASPQAETIIQEGIKDIPAQHQMVLSAAIDIQKEMTETPTDDLINGSVAGMLEVNCDSTSLDITKSYTELEKTLQDLADVGLISDFNRDIASNAGADVAFDINPEAQASCEMVKAGMDVGSSYDQQSNNVTVKYGLKP